MPSAMETVLEFFTGNDWNFNFDEQHQSVRSGINGDNGEWSFVVNVREESGLCVILGIFPQKCPPKRRRACAELLTRINYELVVCNFEMDLDTGEIHLATYYPFPTGQMDAAILKATVGHNLQMMDRFLPAIMSVLYAGTAAAKAYAAATKPGDKTAPAKARKAAGLRRFLNN